MSASTAQIEANRQNSAKSTGPKTAEGKERSRENSYKHGMTGAGIVVPPEEAAEVERRFAAFRTELHPSGLVGLTLVLRAATLAIRMEKCAERDLTTTSERIAEAMAEFEAPQGVGAAEASRLRVEAGRIAAFDPSKEACLARRYEAAAERGFYKALKELRLLERQAQPVDPAKDAKASLKELGSFLDLSKLDEEFAADYPGLAARGPGKPSHPTFAAPLPTNGGRVDVPFTIGRPR